MPSRPVDRIQSSEIKREELKLSKPSSFKSQVSRLGLWASRGFERPWALGRRAMVGSKRGVESKSLSSQRKHFKFPSGGRGLHVTPNRHAGSEWILPTSRRGPKCLFWTRPSGTYPSDSSIFHIVSLLPGLAVLLIIYLQNELI